MVVTAITTALLAESSADVSNMHATALLVLMPQILSDMGNRSENACMFGVSAPLTGFAIVVAVMTIFASGRGGSTVFCHSFAVTGFSACLLHVTDIMMYCTAWKQPHRPFAFRRWRDLVAARNSILKR